MRHVTNQEVINFLKIKSGPYDWTNVRECAGAQLLEYLNPEMPAIARPSFGYRAGVFRYPDDTKASEEVCVSAEAAAAFSNSHTFEDALSRLLATKGDPT